MVLRFSHFALLWSLVFVFLVSLPFGSFGDNSNGNRTQPLSSLATDVSDGACDYPEELAFDTNVLDLYNPLKKYYIPRGSASFYRVIYEIAHGGQPAPSETALAGQAPRVQFLTLRVLSRFGDLDISFDGPSAARRWYGYRCLPTSLRSATNGKPLAPFLNVTCTLVGGTPGTATRAQVGPVGFSVLWSDSTAVSVWGCFHGRQNVHVMSVEPKLTSAQIVASDAAAKKHGLNPAHFVNMEYS